MSMDLNFWKYKEDTAHDHSTVYQTACCDGEVMEVLEVLPIDEILKKVADSFSDWNIQGGGKDFEKEGHGAFQVFTTSQIHVFLQCHVTIDNPDCQLITKDNRITVYPFII